MTRSASMTTAIPATPSPQAVRQDHRVSLAAADAARRRPSPVARSTSPGRCAFILAERGRYLCRCPATDERRSARGSRPPASVSGRPSRGWEAEDGQERRGGLLLLRKGAVFVHRFERPLAAELDESEQPPHSDASRSSAAA